VRLLAVTVNGRDDAWAGGEEDTILHWDGKGWRTFATNPGSPGKVTSLFSTGPSDLWAVDFNPLHWDGKRWTGFCVSGQPLWSVWGSSTRDVWVVGGDVEVPWNLGAHFDGRQWRLLMNSDIAGFALGAIFQAVSGTGADDVWAASPLTHWDGARWAVDPIGSPPCDLSTALWTAVPGEVWTVSYNGCIALRTSAGWIGTPSGTEETLASVWGRTSEDIWAVGLHGTVLHWQGTSWSKVDPATTASLYAVGGKNRDVWAVGEGGAVVRLAR
jgi:hypothetical protein